MSLWSTTNVFSSSIFFANFSLFLFYFQAGSEASQSRKWCRKRGFEEQRFYEMTKLRQQFRNILKDAGLLPAEEHATRSVAPRAGTGSGFAWNVQSLELSSA